MHCQCFNKRLVAWIHSKKMCWKDNIHSLMEFRFEDICNKKIAICVLGAIGIAMAPPISKAMSKRKHIKKNSYFQKKILVSIHQLEFEFVLLIY